MHSVSIFSGNFFVIFSSLSLILFYVNYFHFLDDMNESSNVFVKLNCVGPFDYNMGITTHPIILDAVLNIITKKTNNIIVGDNPAVKDITFTLKKCGLYDIIKKYNVSIINGTNFITIENKNALTTSYTKGKLSFNRALLFDVLAESGIIGFILLYLSLLYIIIIIE